MEPKESRIPAAYYTNRYDINVTRVKAGANHLFSSVHSLQYGQIVSFER